LASQNHTKLKQAFIDWHAEINRQNHFEIMVWTFNYGMGIFTISGSGENCLLWTTARCGCAGPAGWSEKRWGVRLLLKGKGIAWNKRFV